MKKIILTLLISIGFFLGLTYVQAQEENIKEGENKQTEVFQ